MPLKSSERHGTPRKIGSRDYLPDDFYVWMCEGARPKEKPPGSWLSELDHDALINSLPEEYRQHPLSILDHPDADPNVVASCLRAYIAKIHASPGSTSSSASLPELSGLFSNTNAGRKASFWIQQQRATSQSQLGNPLLVNAVTHLLVAETNFDDIWEMYGLRDKAGLTHAAWSSSMSTHEKRSWRSLVLRYTVEASAYWNDGDLHQPLKIFLKAVRLDVKFHDSGYKKLTGTWLMSQILRYDSWRLNPAVYDEFCERLKATFKDPTEREYHLVALKAIHPTRPDPFSALQYLKANERPQDRSKYFQERLSDKGSVGFMFLKVVANQFWRGGFMEEVRWILDFARDNTPQRFATAEAIWRKKQKKAAKKQSSESSTPLLDSSQHSPDVAERSDPESKRMPLEEHENGTSAFPL